MNKQSIFPFIFYLLLMGNNILLSQNTRISDNSTIAWFSVNSTFKLTPKVGFTTEYHWRRVELANKPQAGLWRSSINSGLVMR